MNQRARERIRVFTRVSVALIAVFWIAITLAALYFEYPLFVQLLEDYRAGWLPRSILVTFIVFGGGLIVTLFALLYWLLTAWKENDGRRDEKEE